MASPESLRRIARLTHKLEHDLKAGGMALPWKALFRTNAILTRVVAHLAEHLASEAEERSPGAVRRARETPPRRTRVTLDIESQGVRKGSDL